MSAVSTPPRKMSWQEKPRRVSVLAEMARRKELIAQRLAELRDENGLSQEKAAAHVGVTMRQWQRWEAGESTPYPRNLEQIAERFGISITELFEPPRSSNGDGTQPTEQPAVISRLVDLQSAVEALRESQSELLQRVAALAEEAVETRREVHELREVLRVRRQSG